MGWCWLNHSLKSATWRGLSNQVKHTLHHLAWNSKQTRLVDPIGIVWWSGQSVLYTFVVVQKYISLNGPCVSYACWHISKDVLCCRKNPRTLILDWMSNVHMVTTHIPRNQPDSCSNVLCTHISISFARSCSAVPKPHKLIVIIQGQHLHPKDL